MGYNEIIGFLKSKDIEVGDIYKFATLEDFNRNVVKKIQLKYGDEAIGGSFTAQKAFGFKRAVETPRVMAFISKQAKKESRKREALEFTDNLKTREFFARADITSPSKLRTSLFNLSKEEAVDVFFKVTGRTDKISMRELRERAQPKGLEERL